MSLWGKVEGNTLLLFRTSSGINRFLYTHTLIFLFLIVFKVSILTIICVSGKTLDTPIRVPVVNYWGNLRCQTESVLRVLVKSIWLLDKKSLHDPYSIVENMR